MNNTLTDLNNHLFAAMERLNDEDLSGEDLERELARSKGITDIADKIIQNSKTVLEAVKYSNDYCVDRKDLPRLLGGEAKK